MRQEFINWEEKEKKRERGEEINLFNFFCHFNSICQQKDIPFIWEKKI